MAERQKYYITTAIAYPNGAPHIGHAYEVVAADAIARFKRLDGDDVFFMTGTDEHGLKIQQAADRAGLSAKALVDEMAQKFRAMADRLECRGNSDRRKADRVVERRRLDDRSATPASYRR